MFARFSGHGNSIHSIIPLFKKENVDYFSFDVEVESANLDTFLKEESIEMTSMNTFKEIRYY